MHTILSLVTLAAIVPKLLVTAAPVGDGTLVVREPEPMMISDDYKACYASYESARDVDHAEIVKRCSKAKREPGPDPMMVSDRYQACYVSYESARDLDHDEIAKRCSKAKREAEPDPMMVSDRYQACYASYESARDLDHDEIAKRCGKAKREAEPDPMNISNDYRACYVSYESARDLDHDEIVKRCSKAKREASPMRPDYQASYNYQQSYRSYRKREPEPELARLDYPDEATNESLTEKREASRPEFDYNDYVEYKGAEK